MIAETEWILFDTETTGFKTPIYVVELAAQRMKGWVADGPPFRHLINQNAEIPSEASRVHGYTREILERDGELPNKVYAKFSTYVESRPLVAYNLSYDLDDVLIPEWKRLGLSPVGQAGFCAYRFAQRLLDPVPAGNCKLQTLRQYYRLPERGAHTGLGDVETVIDLFQTVLKPLAEDRGLLTWSDLVQYTTEEWFPSRIPFGKHKGRDFRDAKTDTELNSWLVWLCSTSNQKSVGMGKWYLGELTKSELAEKSQKAQAFPSNQPSDNSLQKGTHTGTGIVEYVDLDAKKYEQLIRLSRERLSELSATFMEEKRKIEFNNAALFRRVEEYYQRRDKLVLVIKYRRSFLDVLLTDGEEEAETVTDEYNEAQAEADQEYEDARKKTENIKALSEEEAAQLQDLWKSLVKVFHPDRYRSEPEKQAIYEKLISVINDARETGNIDLLVEISKNPDAYIDKQGWTSIDLDVQSKSINLKKLYEAIEVEIVERIEALTELRGSPDYRVAMYCNGNSERLEEVAKQQIEALNEEISDLRQEAERLKNEIEELTENQALG